MDDPRWYIHTLAQWYALIHRKDAVALYIGVVGFLGNGISKLYSEFVVIMIFTVDAILSSGRVSAYKLNFVPSYLVEGKEIKHKAFMYLFDLLELVRVYVLSILYLIDHII